MARRAMKKRQTRNAKPLKKRIIFILFFSFITTVILSYLYFNSRGYIAGIKSLKEWGSAGVEKLINEDEKRYIGSLSEDVESGNKLGVNNTLEKVKESDEPSIAEPSEYREIDRDYLNSIIKEKE